MEIYGHCVKCCGKKRLINPIEYKKPNNRSKNHLINMMKGRCPDCDGVIYVITSHH